MDFSDKMILNLEKGGCFFFLTSTVCLGECLIDKKNVSEMVWNNYLIDALEAAYWLNLVKIMRYFCIRQFLSAVYHWIGSKFVLIVTANIRVHEFFKTSYFKTGIRPIPGARMALNKLSRFCNLSVVTYVISVKLLSTCIIIYTDNLIFWIYICITRSRQNAIKEHTIDWIEKHYPGLFQEIHFGNHFALDGASRPKSELCRYACKPHPLYLHALDSQLCYLFLKSFWTFCFKTTIPSIYRLFKYTVMSCNDAIIPGSHRPLSCCQSHQCSPLDGILPL
jgi:hypothetical protein